MGIESLLDGTDDMELKKKKNDKHFSTYKKYF